jgi:putative membrane protein
MGQLLHWVIVSLLLLLIANFIPGIAIDNFATAMIAIFVFGLINVFIKPLLLLLTLPINLLTLGLFTVVINAGLFLLGAHFVDGFHVDGFISALVGSVLLSVTAGLFEARKNPKTA